MLASNVSASCLTNKKQLIRSKSQSFRHTKNCYQTPKKVRKRSRSRERAVADDLCLNANPLSSMVRHSKSMTSLNQIRRGQSRHNFDNIKRSDHNSMRAVQKQNSNTEKRQPRVFKKSNEEDGSIHVELSRKIKQSVILPLAAIDGMRGRSQMPSSLVKKPISTKNSFKINEEVQSAGISYINHTPKTRSLPKKRGRSRDQVYKDNEFFIDAPISSTVRRSKSMHSGNNNRGKPPAKFLAQINIRRDGLTSADFLLDNKEFLKNIANKIPTIQINDTDLKSETNRTDKIIKKIRELKDFTFVKNK